jgi:hypothetical protein
MKRIPLAIPPTATVPDGPVAPRKTAVAKRWAVRAALVVTAVAVLLAAAGFFWRLAGGPTILSTYSCSSISQKAFRSAEAFIKTQVTDASDFAAGDGDCFDDGEAFLTFTSAASPADLGEMLITDARCERVWVPERSDEDSLSCAHGRYEFLILVAGHGRSGSTGELHVSLA